VFVRSAAEKARLLPLMAPGNQDKLRSAPVTVIVAFDNQFHAQLGSQFPVNPQAAAMFAANPALTRDTALRNSSLQGAYSMLAARALGLDVGPMSGFDANAINAAFFPDGQWQANFLINLGWGDKSTLRPRLPRLGFDAVARILRSPREWPRLRVKWSPTPCGLAQASAPTGGLSRRVMRANIHTAITSMASAATPSPP
jgi:3-hydroxypropanoate dehydrogenase